MKIYKYTYDKFTILNVQSVRMHFKMTAVPYFKINVIGVSKDSDWSTGSSFRMILNYETT